MGKVDALLAKKDDIVSRFKEFVCPSCLPNLERIGIPIKARLDAGKKLRLRDTLKLTRSLCPACIARIKQNAKELQH